MQGKRIIQSLKLSNFLSFGSTPQEIELQPLNVLIGPNASGKSNFIEAFRILNAAPEDISKPMRDGGGIKEYSWKGKDIAVADIQVDVEWEREIQLRYFIRFSERRMTSDLHLIEEYLASLPPNVPPETIFELFSNAYSVLYSKELFEGKVIGYKRENVSPDLNRSILSQIKDPIRYPALSRLQDVFSTIQFYTGWDMGRYGVLRYPQRSDLPSATLLEDGSNLGLVLINKPASVRQQITERLKAVLPTVEEIFPKVEGGTVPLYIREKGFSTPTPAARLSEGTLRYLCLLTLLLDPTPPPIICLEEPEAGLHPHVVSQIAELLIDASQRTQLIVTTHSDALISGLSDCPEAIIVCERDEDGTKLRRLEAEQIKPWLDRYAIGDLWRMGEIGGVR